MKTALLELKNVCHIIKKVRHITESPYYIAHMTYHIMIPVANIMKRKNHTTAHNRKKINLMKVIR